MKRVNSESNTKQCLSIAESCASSTTVKQIKINIDEIKRYSTVTNPIKADDLNTPQAYAYSLRRAIVTDCTPEQRAKLVELLNGKDTAEGVTFNNTKANRDRLHRWQNEQSRKERAAILGEGWQYVDGLNHGTQPGDLVTCIDGTRGRVTNAAPECCVIEFETENGQRLTVAGYFCKERTPLQDSPEITQTAQDFADALEIKAGDIYVCADNEEGKQLYRDTYRDCIDEVIRDVVSLQTNIDGGRKGGWIDLDSATRIIGERIFIATKSNNAEYNSETVLREYIMEELCRLQDAGRIDATTNKHGQTIIKWTPERILAYIARCKELEAEALAQMPYKVGDTVRSCYGDTGRVVEMYPEVTGDTDNPHLIYEYDGKPFVSVVILDAEGTRHAANWSVFTLESASEIKPTGTQTAQEITEAEGIKVGDTVRHNKHEEVATVTAIREAFVNDCDGYRYLYTLDFGQSVTGPFGVELNGGEFLREAFTPCTPDGEAA